MTAELKSSLVTSIDAAAKEAGLTMVSVTQGESSDGRATAIFQLGLPGAAAGKTLPLQLSDAFEFDKPELLPQMTAHLAGEAKRLRNPRPECYVTLAGLPLAFGQFQWPFHRSTSGADTLHRAWRDSPGGRGAHNLHAKIAASVTLTFAEIVPAMEQPYAETFIYNAVRKTVDMGQLEFLKSGNRQPVPVTTRLLQPLAEEIHLYGDRRYGAVALPAEQGLLALRRAGGGRAGLDCRPARRAVPEHD